MKANNQLYKSIILILVLVLGVVSLYAIKTEETPRFILFLGRFHPLVLHLPIGALVVGFFIDILGRYNKNYSEVTIRNLLGFTSITAIITCFIGYFLSLEGGYQEEALDLHFYTGIATAILATVLFLISTKPNFKSDKFFLPLFVISLVGISVAGHFGSVLTHGDNFLTEYASVSEEEKTIEVVDSLRIYGDVVSKILDQKCIQCHNASKQKGELSLITEEEILKGGVTGLAVVEGKASESLLYTSLLLPISDEKHMPPEGKPQLTKDEIWLIEHWINNNLDFKNYADLTKGNDTLIGKLEKYLVFNEIKIDKAPKEDIETVRSAGYRILELVPGEARLNVKLLQGQPTQETIEQLELLDEQIIELDLGNSKLSNEMIKVFKKLKNLKMLRMNNPGVSDVALDYLKDLEHLEVLNIYNTSITNEGLSKFLVTANPKQIYAWQTAIDKKTASELSATYNVKIQQSIVYGFVENSQLEQPLITPTKTVFTDTIHINIESRIKNVELRYTLDGKTPDSTSKIFTDKLILDGSKTLKVASFKKGWEPSEILTKEFAKIEHRVASFTIKNKPEESYPDANKLFDLEEGSLDFQDGNWTGYFGKDINTTIDIGSVETVNNVSFSTLENVGSWILYPKHFTVYASDAKNGNFKKIGDVSVEREGEGGGDIELKKVTLNIPETKARYFRILIENYKVLPDWHPSAGNSSWLFVDEIYVW